MTVSALLVCGAIASADSARPVWIDTDPACDGGWFNDVDDCWALLQALQSDALSVRGISSTFGNAEIETTDAIARELVRRASRALPFSSKRSPVYRGARSADRHDTEASDALAAALAEQALTVIALGPLTNLATVISRHPELASRITELVAVAGTRPGARRLHAGASAVLHFHDENFRKDPEAFETVLRSRVPVVLIPFEATDGVALDSDHLQSLARGEASLRWLADRSRSWSRFSSSWLGGPGFRPFDSLAVSRVVDPNLFSCETLSARVHKERSLFFARDALQVSPVGTRGARVTYCSRVDSNFADILVARLTQSPLAN